MKSSGLSAVTLVPLAMAIFSLFSMMGMYQINRIVQQDLYRYGLQFSMRWAKPYWDVSIFVFAVGWFNIILAVAFLLYVVTYERREAKQFAAEVRKEMVNIETKPTEKAEEQARQALTSSEIQEKAQKETPATAAQTQTSEKKETGQEQITPYQPAQNETPKGQEQEPTRSSETEQKDMKPEKKEETPIIIGLTEEELQTSS